MVKTEPEDHEFVVLSSDPVEPPALPTQSQPAAKVEPADYKKVKDLLDALELPTIVITSQSMAKTEHKEHGGMELSRSLTEGFEEDHKAMKVIVRPHSSSNKLPRPYGSPNVGLRDSTAASTRRSRPSSTRSTRPTGGWAGQSALTRQSKEAALAKLVDEVIQAREQAQAENNSRPADPPKVLPNMTHADRDVLLSKCENTEWLARIVGTELCGHEMLYLEREALNLLDHDGNSCIKMDPGASVYDLSSIKAARRSTM
ncbi:hypothetical protein AYO20_10245 [Fonsecaea nubica]|uniref:Uncharacterized protein n=1 Tax=Fonsecaea nubica TaxID=856822 RepID=A0A178CBM6_9EURO|nr:hypothetical protein AYO20_10245 [Fonsecaea nubica]OAL26111.1 hypothetical protein AYO20_10245 [Fonsecaea nubica]